MPFSTYKVCNNVLVVKVAGNVITFICVVLNDSIQELCIKTWGFQLPA